MLSKIDAAKFNTLIELNALINSSDTGLRPLLSRILDSATKLCKGEASSLMLVNKETKELYFEATTGSKGKGSEAAKYTVKLNEGIAGWVATHNKSLIVNDVENDKRHSKKIPDKTGYVSKTMIAAPMRINGECIGVIEMLNKKGNARFTQEDLDWLEIFANQAALAARNTQNFEKAAGEIKELQKELSHNKGYHTLIAKSPVILEKLAMIKRIAATDSSVLLLGESGTGKELFAEKIHVGSARKDAPFVRVNCAALSEDLLESELFGHVKGAFAGAIQDREGRFELAAGGTVFFDEICVIPLSLQAKILGVIQEKTFKKSGSNTAQTADVRILAATNRDIEAMVEKGEFRNDLYHRLNVLPLYIPPLRQRPEDIPELADFFLKKYSAETKKRFTGFSAEAAEFMLSYAWPGNVRELENCVERACTIGGGNVIQKDDLFMRKSPGEPDAAETSSRNLKEAVNGFKARFIRRVLEENNWNQTEAAKALDIQRTYLSRLIKDLSIDGRFFKEQ